MVSNSIQMVSQRLLLKLPEEIIINHILPYTYSLITVELSEDIKDYVKNTQQLKNLYNTTQNHIVLFRGLITYLREISSLSEHVYISQKFIDIMSRDIMLKNYTREVVIQYISKKIIKPKQLNYTRFFALLFGLMNVDERKRFMVDIADAEKLYIIPTTTPHLEQILSE